ncbi:MAG: carbohydrate-binding protein, partial [Muribaculaceae bacterium]|nr:carbohydrate-binding protein [Muribaculaceae bacterium]
YNPDGSIQEVPYWFDNVVEQIEPFDPYREVEAETMSWGYGMRTTPRNQWAPDRWNQLVTAIDDGDYIRVSGVDFADGPKAFSVKAQCPLYGGVIEVRVDDVDGPQIGEIIISGTKNKIETFTVPTSSVTGIHDLYLVFKGSKQQKNNLFNLDSWQFSK